MLLLYSSDSLYVLAAFKQVSCRVEHCFNCNGSHIINTQVMTHNSCSYFKQYAWYCLNSSDSV